MIPLFVDTDPGIDDALALLMVFAAARERLAALGTVSGNVDVEQATDNASLLLELAGVPDVPIHRGAASSLRGSRCEARHVHGADGLGGAGRRPARPAPRRKPAAVALVETARAAPSGIDLLALGPLTNLALALALEPELPRALHRVVWMGGSLSGQGNVTATAEFNAFVDPEALHRVLIAGIPLEVVSWDTTLEHRVPLEPFRGWLEGPGERATLARAMVAHLIDTGIVDAEGGVALPDPLAAAVMLAPESVTRSERQSLRVDLCGETRGRTVAETGEDGPDADASPVTLVRQIDMGIVERLVRLGLGVSP